MELIGLDCMKGVKMIIDSAVCLTSQNGKLNTDDWKRRMDRCGIGHAVIAPSEAYVAVFNNDGNQHIAGVVKKYPESCFLSKYEAHERNEYNNGKGIKYS